MIGTNVLQQKGLICFEEITDYSILEEFKKKSPKKRKEPEPSVSDDDNEDDGHSDEQLNSVSKKPKVLSNEKKKDKSKKKKKKSKETGRNSTSTISLHDVKDSSAKVDTAQLEEKMTAWSDMVLPKKILRALYDKAYYEPTPIQKLVLPEAIKNKSNIIGTAQTGSGKTLAFGLPILTHLHDFYLTKEKKEGPLALILTPTRELALQVKDHLQAACKHMKTKIVGLVGGISLLKQERLLSKSPDIVVATPGRLMQLIDDSNEFLLQLPQIKYLVIDEADRMIEKGHFREMTKILGLVNSDPKAKAKRQNFLFSATLITKFSGDYDELDPAKKEKSEKQQKKEERALLRDLVDKIQMAREPKMFDLTTRAVTAENLYESKIFCQKQEKDIYLYYFLCKYKGRTLVFSNSIDCVRRLTNLFRLLRRTPLHLHANMNQKQRLKNLERFNAEADSVLIASDVASRGLDIPNVQHVIHYQVPRSAEIYVHRSGRTARSHNEGLSVMLVAADEMHLYRKILKTFNRESDIKDYPIDNDYFDECKSRVSLAIKIDKLEHQMGKEKSNANWYEKHAKMLDLELDDELVKETHQDSDQLQKNRQKLQSWKQELRQALDRTIYPKFMSRKYLHPDSVKKVADINDSSSNALTEFKDKKKKKKKNVVC